MSNKLFLNQQIFNLNTKFKHEQNKGLALTNALIIDLKAQGIKVKINPRTNSFTKHVFITLPKALKLALQNQDVILVDNTYKTNKYNIMLLHIVSKL
jgi:hypothetical protein